MTDKPFRPGGVNPALQLWQQLQGTALENLAPEQALLLAVAPLLLFALFQGCWIRLAASPYTPLKHGHRQRWRGPS